MVGIWFGREKANLPVVVFAIIKQPLDELYARKEIRLERYIVVSNKIIKEGKEKGCVRLIRVKGIETTPTKKEKPVIRFVSSS